MSRTGAIASVGAAAAPGNSLGTYAGLVRLFSFDRARFVHAFKRKIVIIGRDPSCDVVLTDEGISRRHAMFEFGAGRWTIEDLESTTGTIVGRTRISSRWQLDANDEVRFGNDLFKFVPVGAEGYERCIERPVISPTPYDATSDPRAEIVGGPAMHNLAAALTRVASGGVNVVFVGEAGTEKEICARHLHALRKRAGAFVRLDLFGRGPDALAELAPALLSAAGGTVFLDDIDPIKIDDTASTAASPHFIQAARALAGVPSSQQRVHDLGAARASTPPPPEPPGLDVHLVFGATVAPPPTAPASAPPRYVTTLPPLRDRKEDVDVLCRARLRAVGRGDVKLDDWFLCALARHDYPGNVRELDQLLAAALARCGGDVLTPDLLPPAVRKLAPRRR